LLAFASVTLGAVKRKGTHKTIVASLTLAAIVYFPLVTTLRSTNLATMEGAPKWKHSITAILLTPSLMLAVTWHHYRNLLPQLAAT